jgi:hypothetical protein
MNKAQRKFSTRAMQREFATRRALGLWTSPTQQQAFAPEIGCWVREDLLIAPAPVFVLALESAA